MNTLKDRIRRAPVHERRIEIRTYPAEKDQVIVEGWLKDERLTHGFSRDGRKRPPGVVHHLCVRLLLGGEPPTILEAEAEMPVVPHPLCPTVADTVKKVVGLAVVAGFSEKVRKKLYGVEGCSHLMHLILAMGPAGLHGLWAHQGRKKVAIPETLEEIPHRDYLINSCRLWREDGPLVSRLRQTLKKREET
jgi:hypothetical protein